MIDQSGERHLRPARRHVLAGATCLTVGSVLLIGCGAAANDRQAVSAATERARRPRSATPPNPNPSIVSTTTSTVVPPPSVQVEPEHAMRVERPTNEPEPAPTAPPGVPIIVVTVNAAARTCTVSWTPPVYNGGSPVVDYLVTAESPAVPPSGGVDIGTALQTERTRATTATVGIGYTVSVVAENIAGAGPAAWASCAS